MSDKPHEIGFHTGSLKKVPVFFESSPRKRLGNLDTLASPNGTNLTPMTPKHGGGRHAAISHHLSGYPLCDLVSKGGINDRIKIRMGMGVDKTGSKHPIIPIYHRSGIARF